MPRRKRRGENGLCADPLAKSRFYRRALLSSFSIFPLPPCFSFSERLLWHGSSHKSTAEKLSRKTFIVLIRNSSCMELFFVLRSLVRAYIGTNFSFLPLTCANFIFREPHFHRPVPLCLLPEKGKIIHGGNSNENVGYQTLER